MPAEMPELARIIILATIAGFLSSLAGGAIAVFFGRPDKKFIGLSFVFAASVLTTLVFVDFIPHARGHGHFHTEIDPHTGMMYQYWFQHSGAGLPLAVLGIAAGVALVAALGLFDKYGHEHIHGILPHSEDCSHSEWASDGERRRMVSSAFFVAFAIIVHDVPKGLAIGTSGSVIAAAAIGLSCIPEGMSIAIPLKAGGTKRWKILGICALAGLATVFGAVTGYLVGGINVYVSGLMFAVAAGCILAVVFSEILPLAFEYSGRTKWTLAVMLAGVLIVLALNYFFHELAH